MEVLELLVTYSKFQCVVKVDMIDTSSFVLMLYIKARNPSSASP
jgi:hypothetical protein